MNSRFRPLFALSAVLSLSGCDKPTPPAAELPPAVTPGSVETENQLADARDALQRQALEIETKTALMEKQLAGMEQALKDRENAELRGSLDALKQQNDELRVQAEAARRQSNAITQRIATLPQPNVAPQPVLPPRDYSLFYERLAPFGRWLEVNGYGYCWRPTITVAGWRPYVDGCWVWSSLGWAWQSNEPFGWATYHYGRWVNLARLGWVWVPGSEWAPAWVAWRQSRDCVGWAPLPPEPGVCTGVYRDCDSRYGLGPSSYTFINTNQFVRPSYTTVYAPVSHQTTIFQNSVNVTQIVPSSGHGHGHAFSQQGGPPRSQIEQVCGRPVPQRQVQTVPAGQVPEHHQQQHRGPREFELPVAMVELPAAPSGPGTRPMRPEIRERIQQAAPVSGFEGIPQHVASEIRQTIAKEKETAAVQQQPQPTHGRMPHGSPQHPREAPALANGVPQMNAPVQETVRPATAVENPVVALPASPPGAMPATDAASVSAVSGAPPPLGLPHENRGPRHRDSASTQPATPVAPVMPAITENKVAEPAVAAPTLEPERAAPPVAMTPPAAPPQAAAESSVSQPAVPAGQAIANAAAEAEKARMAATAAAQDQAAFAAQQQRMAADQAAAETDKTRRQAEAAAMQQRQEQEGQARAQAEKMAADQAAAAAEAEKARMQAAAAQQEALAAQQQRMAADQAAAETEKVRQQAAAMQQQQDLVAQQQRATAERMASEQAAAAEAARAQQAQAEAAAMQRQQQEEATRRAAEEQQQMRAQQEAAQRAQEMAQRQAEEQARRQQEAEMQRQAQEQARRAQEEQMRAQQEAAQRAQEMAQRQAEEQARRQQEVEMQRQAQEQARRAQEEQMRAQQEAAQRAQEMAQRQAEEQARRAQEQAQRAAAEAARNQPQPAPGS